MPHRFLAWLQRAAAPLAMTALLLAPAGARAERQLVDRVVAMVNGEAILLSEVLQEMNLVRLQRNLGDLDEKQQQQLFDKVLQDMIDDQLLVAQAKAKKYEVSDEDVREAVDEAVKTIKQRMGGEEQYQRELQKQGLTEAELRDMHKEQKRKQILASRVIQGDIRKQVSVTDDQVRTFYQAHPDSVPAELRKTAEKLRLAHILIVPHPDEKKLKAAQAKIAAAQKRVAAGEDFAKVARELSEWPTAKNGGFMGSFHYGDFESDVFDEAVSKLQPGQVSDVVETRFGLQIVKLESRKGDEMTARHIVVKLEPDENAMVKAFEKARSVRQRLQKGESFEELAKQFSDDPNTRDKGGVVADEWKHDDLLPEFRTALDSTQVGGVSSVVRSQSGFHIFKVLARNDSRVAKFEDIQADLRKYLEQRELDRRYQTYLADLRKRFPIEIKS